MYEGTDLISLHSTKGQKLLAECKDTCYNPYIHHIFAKQVGRSNCGIQSAALVMSSEILAKKYPDNSLQQKQVEVPYTESGMFSFDATTKVATEEYIDKRGLTLEELINILTNHNKKVTTFYSSNSTPDEFRQLARKALQETSTGNCVIVNYHMGELGQGSQWGGHFSPLGAYHEESDRFLIFDTWPDTEECWAKSGDLFEATKSIDPDSNLTRGFIIIHG